MMTELRLTPTGEDVGQRGVNLRQREDDQQIEHGSWKTGYLPGLHTQRNEIMKRPLPQGSISDPVLPSAIKHSRGLMDTCTHREGEETVLRLVDEDAEDGTVQNDANDKHQHHDNLHTGRSNHWVWVICKMPLKYQMTRNNSQARVYSHHVAVSWHTRAGSPWWWWPCSQSRFSWTAFLQESTAPLLQSLGFSWSWVPWLWTLDGVAPVDMESFHVTHTYIFIFTKSCSCWGKPTHPMDKIKTGPMTSLPLKINVWICVNVFCERHLNVLEVWTVPAVRQSCTTSLPVLQEGDSPQRHEDTEKHRPSIIKQETHLHRDRQVQHVWEFSWIRRNYFLVCGNEVSSALRTLLGHFVSYGSYRPLQSHKGFYLYFNYLSGILLKQSDLICKKHMLGPLSSYIFKHFLVPSCFISTTPNGPSGVLQTVTCVVLTPVRDTQVVRETHTL